MDGLEHTETKETVLPKITYAFTSDSDRSWTRGSSASLRFTVKRSAEDETTYGRFASLSVDGNVLPEDSYAKESGSLKGSLTPSYLNTLKDGMHTLKADFRDGGYAELSFEVQSRKGGGSASSETGSAHGTANPAGTMVRIPDTRDQNHTALWAGVFVISLTAAAAAVLLRKKYS